MFASEASMPVVLAPSLARLWQNPQARFGNAYKTDRTSDNNPPPHPTSRTSSPSNGVILEGVEGVPSSRWISCSFCLINSILTGFILCSIANSPRSSHHWDESLEKSSISDASTVLTLVDMLLKSDRATAMRRGRAVERTVLRIDLTHGESIGRFPTIAALDTITGLGHC